MYNDFHEDYLMHYEKGQRAKDAKYSKIHISKNGKPWYEYPRSYYNTVKSFANNFGKNMGKTVTNFKNSKEAKKVVSTANAIGAKVKKLVKTSGDEISKNAKNTIEKIKNVDIKKTGKAALDKVSKTTKSIGDSAKKTGKDALEKIKKTASSTKKRVEDVTGVTAKKNLVGNQTKYKLSQREFNTHSKNASDAKKEAEYAKKLMGKNSTPSGRAEVNKYLDQAKSSSKAADYELGRMKDFAKKITANKKEYDNSPLGKLSKAGNNIKSFLSNLGKNTSKVTTDAKDSLNKIGKNVSKEVDKAKDSLVEKGKEVKAKIDQEKWYKENSGKVGMNSYEDIKKSGKMSLNGGNVHLVVTPTADELENFSEENYDEASSNAFEYATGLKIISDFKKDYNKSKNKAEYLNYIEEKYGEESARLLTLSDEEFGDYMANGLTSGDVDVKVVKKGDNIFIEVKQK